jgi:excisionase family DNA binding protein
MVTSIFAPNPRSRLLTANEVADDLNVNIWTVYKWVRQKRLPCIRLSRKAMRFDPAIIAKFKRLRTTGRLPEE